MSAARTYVTFRIISGEAEFDPDTVTERLGLEPDKTWRVGDLRPHAKTTRHRNGGWLIRTDAFDSLDIKEHVDLVLDRIEHAVHHLADLQAAGAKCDVFCFWATENGQGGPDLDPAQMRRLAALDLPIRFDIYRW